MTQTSAPTGLSALRFTDSRQRTAQYCGGLVGALFVGVVFAGGMLTTITLLGWYVAKRVERAIRAS